MGRRKDIPTSVASAGFTSRRSRADRQTAHSGVRPRIASNQANVNDNRGEYHVKATSGFAASNCRASSSPARNSTARDSTARDSTATNRSIASPRGNSQACYFERRSSCVGRILRSKSVREIQETIRKLDFSDLELQRLSQDSSGLQELYNQLRSADDVHDTEPELVLEDMASLKAIGRGLVDVLMVGLPQRIQDWQVVLEKVPLIENAAIVHELLREPDAQAAGPVGKIMARHGLLPRMVRLGSDGISSMIRNLLRDGTLRSTNEGPICLSRDSSSGALDRETVSFREASLQIARIADIDLRSARNEHIKHIDDAALPASDALLNWFFEVVPTRSHFFRDFRAERRGGDMLLWQTDPMDDFLNDGNRTPEGLYDTSPNEAISADKSPKVPLFAGGILRIGLQTVR